jgi:hypothetical protein
MNLLLNVKMILVFQDWPYVRNLRITRNTFPHVNVGHLLHLNILTLDNCNDLSAEYLVHLINIDKLNSTLSRNSLRYLSELDNISEVIINDSNINISTFLYNDMHHIAHAKSVVIKNNKWIGYGSL